MFLNININKTNLMRLLLICSAIAVLSACTTLNKSMKEPVTFVELKKSDFILSDQLDGSATEITILAIDWARFFQGEFGQTESGQLGNNPTTLNTNPTTVSIPTIGSSTNPSKVESYALYDLLSKNPGYDVLFYPTFEQKEFKVLFFFSKTEVKIYARLGKLNKILSSTPVAAIAPVAAKVADIDKTAGSTSPKNDTSATQAPK